MIELGQRIWGLCTRKKKKRFVFLTYVVQPNSLWITSYHCWLLLPHQGRRDSHFFLGLLEGGKLFQFKEGPAQLRAEKQGQLSLQRVSGGGMISAAGFHCQFFVSDDVILVAVAAAA